MREHAAVILRRLVDDLPWLVAIAALLAAGFVVVMLAGGEPFGRALGAGAGISIGLVAVMPIIWIRRRSRELGGRRTAIAFGMAVVWGGSVVLVTLPFLNWLDRLP